MKWPNPWSLVAALAVGRLAWWRLGSSGTPPTPPPGLVESERFLSGLLPEVAARARQLLVEAWRQGISLVVTSGYRSAAEQSRLYAQGRTTPGNIVTDADAGWSWHNYRRGFDVAVRDASGRATWPPSSSAVWSTIGRIGRSVGLDWGRDFGDDPHFDYHPGLTIEQARGLAGIA